MVSLEEVINDVDYPIKDVIKQVSDLPDFKSFKQVVFGELGRLTCKDSDDVALGVDLQNSDVFRRALVIAINIDDYEVVIRLILLGDTLNSDLHLLACLSAIKDYYPIQNEIYNRTYGYMTGWLNNPVIAYDVFTVLRTIKPGLARNFLLQICDLHHEKSKEDDTRKALLTQCINDFYFAGGNLIGQRGSDLISNAIITLREIADKLESLQKVTSSLPNVDEFMNS